MKATYFLIAFFYASALYAQQPPPAFYEAVSRCDSFYMAKQYKAGALAYNQLFTTYPSFVHWTERYNAACNWALAGEPDSAFFQLQQACLSPYFTNYNQLANDADLDTLHSDSRWQVLLDTIHERRDGSYPNANKALMYMLDTIYQTDQGLRGRLQKTEDRYGYNSNEVKQLWRDISFADSVNYIKIAHLLDTYGWLPADSIGGSGNNLLFLVIQHSSLTAQLKYLPVLREAVRKGNAKGHELALLEDRVAMRQNKKQIYGSQIFRDKETGKYYLYPLTDPTNVDRRRSAVGLQPLNDYVMMWGLTWNLKQYKAGLAETKRVLKKRKRK